MTPTQVFGLCLDIVAAESGISKELILSKSRERDVVDTRYILFYVCRNNSMYPAQIAREANVSEANVYHVLANFDSRIKQSRFMQNVLTDTLKALKHG